MRSLGGLQMAPLVTLHPYGIEERVDYRQSGMNSKLVSRIAVDCRASVGQRGQIYSGIIPDVGASMAWCFHLHRSVHPNLAELYSVKLPAPLDAAVGTIKEVMSAKERSCFSPD